MHAIICATLLNVFCQSNFISCYMCTNKMINVNCVTEKLSRPLYLALSPAYATYRARFNTNVSVNVVPSKTTSISYVTNGIVGPVSDPPVVFANTPYLVNLTHNNEILFPILAQGIVLIYNLPNVNNLNMSVQTVAAIFKGAIDYWNDSLIAKQNPNVKLPNLKIIPIARNDSDATTQFFTSILTNVDQDWNRTGSFVGPMFVNNTCCNSTKWPNNAIQMYGNDIVGIVGLVYSVAYSIGYAASSSISQYAVSIVNLLEKEDDITSVIQPSVENIAQTMSNFVEKSKPIDVLVKVDNGMANGAYPLTIYAYLILNYTYDKTIDCCIIQETAGFIDWLMSVESNNLIISNGYVPVIDTLKERIKSLILSRLQCNEGYIYSSYLSTLQDNTDTSSWQPIAITVVCMLALGIGVTVSLTIYFRKFYVDQSRWLIDYSRIRLIQTRNTSSHDSRFKLEDTTSSSLTNLSNSQQRHSANTSTSSQQAHGVVKDMKELMIRGELEENRIYLDPLACKSPQQWSAITKRTVNRLKNIIHKNVTSLLGVTNLNDQSHAVLEYCQKGTLHYVLRTSRYNLTNDIKYQFAFDIAEGLKFLHQNAIIHGYLSSIACYLDGSWTVKIAQWEKTTIYQEENFYQLISHASYKRDMALEESRLIELIYTDPRMATSIDESIDLFSFGFILVEIFTRKLPYSDVVDDGDDSYSELLGKKFGVHYVVQPKETKSHKVIHELVSRCLGPADNRPNMNKICQMLKNSMKSSTGIVDIIMETLERHADALEEKVQERSGELKQVTEKMRHLLHEVMPAQIADNLLSGLPVLPEQFECITIYFSDIVDFTTISAISSPIEVMNLLNDLWIVFDKIIEKYDVYKVDTIGDAYMVCSGLPNRNGMDHCKQIALLSLALLEKCNRFKITHLPEEQLKIRIGINSGPATAGVVGSKMPQYCVFGDTVNTAARMESTSMPQKIQLSERTFVLLNDHFPNKFQMMYRGEIDVKGKGAMRTYWLLNNKK